MDTGSDKAREDALDENPHLCHYCRKKVIITNDPDCEAAGFLLGIHQGASERISVFYWVLCPFFGIREKGDLGVYLYVVVDVFIYTTRGSFAEGHPESRADW